jgi:UDP:flavonoid glycosyltransferase YjiC (YdhE family)
MRVTVIAIGTRGDVQPMLVLAGALRAAGHQVRFATEVLYEPQAAALGLEFYRLSGNSEKFYSGRGGTVFRESLEKPVTEYARFWRAYVAPSARLHLRESVAPCEGAEVLVCQPWLGIGPSLSERFRIPAIITSVFPVPELPTAEFPFPLHAGARCDLPARDVLRSWRRAIPILHIGHDTVQHWRVEALGLRAQTFTENLHGTRTTPHVLGYSPLVVPKPSEWGEGAEVTGYWFLDGATPFRPSRELEEFLSAGEPPVVVGFGSHVGRNPARLTKAVVDALALAGRRGILISGWGGLKSAGLPADIFSAQAIPYDWLLPRSLALVHHGGSGTTAIALRMGSPQVITPFGWDQSFWGHRMAQLGVSPEPVSAKTLTAEQLAAAITQVTTHPVIRRRAAEIGEAIRRERGVENAVAAVERFARRRTSSRAFAVDSRG